MARRRKDENAEKKTNGGTWRASAMARRKPAHSLATHQPIVPEQIERSIVVVRGYKVLLDEQLAGFYGVHTKALVQAVKRNAARFPDDFMFQLTRQEREILRSQFATSSSGSHGGRRYAPYAFTEQGVAMLSSVLRSSRAVKVNIQIMRAFAPTWVMQAFEKQAEIIHAACNSSRRQNGTLIVVRDTLLPKLLSGEIRVKAAEKAVEEVA